MCIDLRLWVCIACLRLRLYKCQVIIIIIIINMAPRQLPFHDLLFNCVFYRWLSWTDVTLIVGGHWRVRLDVVDPVMWYLQWALYLQSNIRALVRRSINKHHPVHVKLVEEPLDTLHHCLCTLLPTLVLLRSFLHFDMTHNLSEGPIDKRFRMSRDFLNNQDIQYRC